MKFFKKESRAGDVPVKGKGNAGQWKIQVPFGWVLEGTLVGRRCWDDGLVSGLTKATPEASLEVAQSRATLEQSLKQAGLVLLKQAIGTHAWCGKPLRMLLKSTEYLPARGIHYLGGKKNLLQSLREQLNPLPRAFCLILQRQGQGSEIENFALGHTARQSEARVLTYDLLP